MQAQELLQCLRTPSMRTYSPVPTLDGTGLHSPWHLQLGISQEVRSPYTSHSHPAP